MICSVMWRGSHKVLNHDDDLYDINERDKSETTSLKFKKEWDKEVDKAEYTTACHTLIYLYCNTI